MEIRRAQFHLFAQLCLLLVAFWSGARGEQQYEFECANKECSDILLEGHTNFPQAGTGELFKLGKNEFLNIYGISQDYYLGQKQNRKGLVKKSYFRVSKQNKDKQLVKIRGSFRENEFVLIDNGTVNSNETNSNEVNSNAVNDSVADQGDKSFLEVTASLKENSSDSSKEENLSEAAEPPKLNEPLVKKLHSRLASGEDARRAAEHLNLKNPEVLNFSEERPDDKQAEPNELRNEVPVAQNESSLPVESGAAQNESLSVESSAVDKEEAGKKEADTNEAGTSEANKNEATKNEAVNNEPVKNDADDLDELRASYKQSIDESVLFKLKELDTKNEQADKSTQTEPVQPLANDLAGEVPAASNEPSAVENTPAEHSSVENPSVEHPSVENPTINNPPHEPAEHLAVKNPATEQQAVTETPSVLHPVENAPSDHVPAATESVYEQAVSTPAPVVKQELPGNHQIDNSIPKNYDKPVQQEVPREEAPREEFKHPPAVHQPAEHLSGGHPSAGQPPVEQPPAVEPAHDQVTSQPPVVRQELPGSRHTDNSIPKNYDNPAPVVEQEEAHQEAPQEAPQEAAREAVREEAVQETPQEPPREEYRHPKQITKPERKANIKNLSRKSREEERPIGESANTKENDSSVLPDVAAPIDNTQEPTICSSSMRTEEPSIAIIALRSLLSNFTHLLPEGMVLFLESGLQVSVRLLMFVFIIGLLWIILFAIKLFYLSMTNETALKNHLYESQSKLSQLQRERDDLRNRLNAQNLRMSRGLEEQRQEVDQLVAQLNSENEKLREGRLVMEAKLHEQLDLVKALQQKIESLNQDSSVLFKENDELSEQLNEELRAREQLQSKLDQLDELNKELITKSEQTLKTVQERDGRIEFLNEQLDEQRKLTTEKEIEIGCLNKMLNELKEDRELARRAPDEDGSAEQEDEKTDGTDGPSKAIERRQSASNFYDVVKLRCEIEKIEKERNDAKERLKASLEKVETLERRLAALEQESSANDEVKSKVLKEKEDAEKYLDFLKKYYSENKNELQKELGVYQYKEKQLVEENRELQSKLETLEKRADESEQKYQQSKQEFEEAEKQMRDELLAANKSASDYWKSTQTLKSELAAAKKDAEYLRQQLRGPSASASSNPSPAPTLQPPVLPKEVFEVLLGVNTGHMTSTGGLPNLNSFGNVSSANFMTAPSPIPPMGPTSVDYQANYHNSFPSLPFTSQPDSSIYNHGVPTSAAYPPIDPPMMLNSNGLISNLANSSMASNSMASSSMASSSMTNSNLINSHPANSMANNLTNSSMANSHLMNSNPLNSHLNSHLMNHSLVGNGMPNADVYGGQDYQYTSLPNLPYPSGQQFDPRFDNSQHPTNAATFANQQQRTNQHPGQHPGQHVNQWEAAHSFANNNSDMNQTDTSMNHSVASSPHPSLQNV